jgi:hypothetical protein
MRERVEDRVHRPRSSLDLPEVANGLNYMGIMNYIQEYQFLASNTNG